MINNVSGIIKGLKSTPRNTLKFSGDRDFVQWDSTLQPPPSNTALAVGPWEWGANAKGRVRNRVD